MWRVSHADVTAFSRSVCPAASSLSSPLFLFLLPQPTPIHLPHVWQGELLWNITVKCWGERMKKSPVRQTLPCISSVWCRYTLWSRRQPLWLFQEGAVAAAAACSCCCCLGCYSFGCDRQRLQHVETGSTRLLWHRLWFVCISCWLAAKRRSRVKCEEQRDYYNLTPDNVFFFNGPCCASSHGLIFFFYMIKNKQRKFYEFRQIRIFIPLFTVAFWIVVCPLSGLTHVWKGTTWRGSQRAELASGWGLLCPLWEMQWFLVTSQRDLLLDLTNVCKWRTKSKGKNLPESVFTGGEVTVSYWGPLWDHKGFVP